jgi:hypothetical protein
MAIFQKLKRLTGRRDGAAAHTPSTTAPGRVAPADEKPGAAGAAHARAAAAGLDPGAREEVQDPTTGARVWVEHADGAAQPDTHLRARGRNVLDTPFPAPGACVRWECW